jgi:hypothetical protein
MPGVKERDRLTYYGKSWITKSCKPSLRYKLETLRSSKWVKP